MGQTLERQVRLEVMSGAERVSTLLLRPARE